MVGLVDLGPGDLREHLPDLVGAHHRRVHPLEFGHRVADDVVYQMEVGVVHGDHLPGPVALEDVLLCHADDKGVQLKNI